MVRLRIRYLGRAECRPWKGADSRRKIDRVRSLGKCGGLPIAPLEHGKWTFSFCEISEILTYFKFQARKIISCGKPNVKNSKSSPITTLMGGINIPKAVGVFNCHRASDVVNEMNEDVNRALGFSWGYPAGCFTAL